MVYKVSRLKKFLVIPLFIILGIYFFSEPHYTPTAISTSAHHAYFPKYIAHKALVSNNFIGNSLEAIQEALASYVEGIELDVRISKDNIPFLYHSETLENFTNCKGAPENHTWEQLQNLSYQNENISKIISLEEVFKIVGSQKYLFLDIKSTKIFDINFAKIISELIKKYHLEETVVVESFNPIFLASMRIAARDVMLMYDFTVTSKAIGEEVQSQFDKIPWLLKQPFFQKQIRRIIRPDILGPRWNFDQKLLSKLIANKYPVICWTVDDIATAQQLFDLGVKGLQTNRPNEIMQAILQTEQTVHDAGGSKAEPKKIIHVKNTKDVINAINEAKLTRKSITIAGRRHSMGGQTLLNNSIHIDMMRMNHVTYNPKNKILTAEAGATWKKIQSILDKNGRSVKVMQSDNIFTVGGSISTNVHGWQTGAGPISSTIKSLKIITADGKIHSVNSEIEPELFKAAIGGYGQFGVIVEAQLETVSNSLLKFHCQFMKPDNFSNNFKKLITNNPNVELAYGRLSVDRDHLFEEVGLFWYEKIDEVSSDELTSESFVALKRAVFRASQYTNSGKLLRWAAEKAYAKKLSEKKSISRNNAMNTDIHILWPLYGKSKDILHEYFIPKEKLSEFLAAAKELILRFNMNILNVTIREIKKDNISLLPYANKNVFGLVFLFSQSQNSISEKKMKTFTKKIIDEVIKVQGTFYLTYRLHYTKDQILTCYPNINEWLNTKHKLDSGEIFSSYFFKYIEQLCKNDNEL